MNLSTQGSWNDLSKNQLPSRPPLVPGVSDYTLSLVLPILTHWLTAAFFETFRTFGIFEKYKLHTTEEEKAKNRVSRFECLRGVLLVQILQTGLGVALGVLLGTEDPDTTENDIALWTVRIRALRKFLLSFFPSSGSEFYWFESLAPFLPILSSGSEERIHDWESFLAKFVYNFIAPLVRFYVALWLADTWVFFIHRAEHQNQWLYKTFHARHHELYIPYSWAGIYDHPIESMFLSVGAYVVAVMGTGMSLRESMVFSVFSSMKAASDHSSYEIPGNPIDFFTSIGAEYHDKHHQRWGFKSNFALHFQFWDRVFGTEYTYQNKLENLKRRRVVTVKIPIEQEMSKLKEL